MSAMSVVKQMEQMSISYGVDGVQGVSELLKHRTGRSQFRHRLLQVGRCQLGNTLLKQITQCAGVLRRHIAVADCLGNGADRLAYPECLSIHTFLPCRYFD